MDGLIPILLIVFLRQSEGFLCGNSDSKDPSADDSGGGSGGGSGGSGDGSGGSGGGSGGLSKPAMKHIGTSEECKPADSTACKIFQQVLELRKSGHACKDGKKGTMKKDGKITLKTILNKVAVDMATQYANDPVKGASLSPQKDVKVVKDYDVNMMYSKWIYFSVVALNEEKFQAKLIDPAGQHCSMMMNPEFGIGGVAFHEGPYGFHMYLVGKEAD